MVTSDGTRVPLEHEHDGVWVGAQALLARRRAPFNHRDVPDYRVEVDYGQGAITVDDPYRFLPTLGEMDLHLVNEGRHELLWTVLGARVHHYRASTGDVSGTSFAVWAPGARGVRLEGDFNSWDGREHPMRQLGESGVWELFVPGVGAGAGYKYVVLGADGEWREKADPMAVWAEMPPATSSRVYESTHEWGDDEWMRSRGEKQPVSEPMSIYEVHLASWRKRHGKVLTWDQLIDELVPYVADLGFSHVELMPVMQHPFGGSWGYHVTSYFAPDSRFGDPDGFRRLVDAFHQHGIGVLLDWVPGHFATDAWALARFDGTPLYEDPNPQRGWHKEWGSHIFNFGRREVRNFLYANALYWLEEFHADGLRVDGVASMLYLDYARPEGEWTRTSHGGNENLEAVQFLQEMNATVYKRVPGATTIAEESTSWPGVTAHHRQRRPGLRLQVEHGLDARLARLPQARAGAPVVAPQRADLRPRPMRSARTSCSRSPTTRSSTARALCCARCPATAGSSWPTSAPTSPSCGPIPASSCCSWAPRSARSRSGRSRASSTGGCSTTPSTSASTG